jgi:hypothetical protein
MLPCTRQQKDTFRSRRTQIASGIVVPTANDMYPPQNKHFLARMCSGDHKNATKGSSTCLPEPDMCCEKRSAQPDAFSTGAHCLTAGARQPSPARNLDPGLFQCHRPALPSSCICSRFPACAWTCAHMQAAGQSGAGPCLGQGTQVACSGCSCSEHAACALQLMSSCRGYSVPAVPDACDTASSCPQQRSYWPPGHAAAAQATHTQKAATTSELMAVG